MQMYKAVLQPLSFEDSPRFIYPFDTYEDCISYLKGEFVRDIYYFLEK